MEEAFPLLRLLWAGETVEHRGPVADLDGVTLPPLPLQQPLEFWTGGMVPAALERCGRFADGWLPSACTPAEVAAARPVIDEAAAEAGREISPEHFGVSLAYAPGPLDPALLAALARTRRGVDPADVVPTGLGAMRSMLEAFLDVGFSKFVVRPLAEPGGMAVGARGAGRCRARPPDMSRSRPVELEFAAHDDPELLARMATVQAGGTGWINLEPVIEEEHEPPAPGPFAFLGGSTHKVPVVTWIPGRMQAGGPAKPTTVGLQHASGPRLAWRLRDLVCRSPRDGG